MWSLPDGRGGHNELCHASACVPWLVAAARGALVIGDFDGDRATDVARDVDGVVVVSLARPGGFREAARRGAEGEHLGAQLLSLGDVNGDGCTDVLALSLGVPATDGSPKVLPPERAPRLLLLRGGHDGLAPPDLVVSLDGWASDLRVAVGDLDGDHHPDIALAGVRAGKTAILAGLRGEQAGPGHAISWSIPVRDVPDRIAIADVDGDGISDLLAFGTSSVPSSWSLWPGKQTGPDTSHRRSWSDPSEQRQSWFGRAAAVGRFDGHTVEVAVAAPGAAKVYIYRRAAAQPDRILSGGASDSFGEKLAAIDLDGDGRDELVVFNEREIIVFSGARAESVLARQPLSPGP